MLITRNRWQTAILTIFHVLFLVLPLCFTWVNEELFEFNKIIVVYLSTIVIAGVWVGQMAWHKKIIWRRTVFDIPIGLFLVSQMLSTLFSIEPHTSLFGYYTRFHGGLLSWVSYAVLFGAFVTYIEKKHIPGLLRTIRISATFILLMAIPEHFGHAFSCLMIQTDRQLATSGLAALSPTNLLNNYNVSCWIQDVQNRVYATFGQPNWLAAYAVTLLPLSIALSVNESLAKKQRASLLWSLLAIGLFITVLFTKSRSGFWAMYAGLSGFTFATLWAERSAKHKDFQMTKSLMLIIVVCLLSMAAFGSPYTRSLIGRSTPVSTVEATPTPANRLEEGGTDSGEIRQIVWSGAVDIWKHYPILGSGVETFAYSYFQHRPMEHNNVSEWDFLYNKAHNEFLNFLATTGIVGLLSYLCMLVTFIGVPLWVVFFAAQTEHKLFAAGIAAGIAALSITNALGFSTVTVSVLMFCLPAMLLVNLQQFRSAELRVSSRVAPDSPALIPSPPSTTSRILLTTGVGLLTIILLWRTLAYWIADAELAKGKQYAGAGELQPALAAFDKATKLNPDEPYILDELGVLYGSAAQSLATSGDATAAAQVGELAVETAKTTIALNPVHPTYYKSLARVYLNLATFDPNYLVSAEGALLAAENLAPTDPKLPYNIAIIREGLGKSDEALADLERTVGMKPNYEDARMSLAAAYEKRNRFADARDQYQYILQYIQPNNTTAQEKLQTLPSANQPATASAKTQTAPKR